MPLVTQMSGAVEAVRMQRAGSACRPALASAPSCCAPPPLAFCRWNADSGAPKRRMAAPGVERQPSNERPVEAIGFLGGSGRLKGVLAAVGADRWLRLWDVLDGSLLVQRFTGHRQGETVQALALAVPPPATPAAPSPDGAQRRPSATQQQQQQAAPVPQVRKGWSKSCGGGGRGEAEPARRGRTMAEPTD